MQATVSASTESDREHMGRMHLVRLGCGHLVAACWVTGNEKDADEFLKEHKSQGRSIETVERYRDDPMPEWCSRECEY